MIIFSGNLFSAELYLFPYTVEKDDTFATILEKFVLPNSIVNAKTPFVKEIRNRNPQVKDWRELVQGTIIQLAISSEYIEKPKLEIYKAATNKKNKEIADKKEKLSSYTGLKASAFYMYSVGNFTQSQDATGEIKFNQNSPVSLGGALSYYPTDSNFSLSSSGYYSYLLSSGNTLTADQISIPPEIGGSIYGEYLLKNYSITPYSGIDYEHFSVFNFTGLQRDGKVYVDGVALTYLTIGMSKSFTLMDRKYFTKFSIAKSIVSTYENNDPQAGSTNALLDKYSGVRLLFYLNTKISDRFFIHSLVKFHQLTGPSNVSSLRIGFGVGYVLF
jgi:hypothetical protein